MKLVVVTVDKEVQPEVLDLLERHGVSGYSIIPSVLGRGETGTHLGTRAFPGENVMVLALVPGARLPALQAGLAELEAGLRPGQGLMAIGLDADRLL